ncbi:hypothetical protein [Mycobacteroides saopaulense]|uniref:Uncharacterized protein n=1 Tax=Mycobacteroides saopaulense TaxID=1578165 RepID=A0ABX3C4E3_9MYCO|nr:hypothetical protein [Mycobacteroides saopaulense]OHT88605.1 hypothetical protein BKG68_01480 [Mycobacteroides saopaulense]OHU13424.1 hypothetical protein BKG73_01485 [Mycobacteroides saopaulense]
MTRRPRGNILALLVIALLVPAYIFGVIRPRYDKYANVAHPVPDLVVTYKQPIVLHGATWSVKGILRESKSHGYHDRATPLPQGTEILRVGFDRKNVPGQQPPAPSACASTLISGPTRWEPQSEYRVTVGGATTELDGVSIGPAGTNGRCQEEGTFQDGFLVPKGTMPDAIDMEFLWGKSDHRIVRFQLG